MSELRLELLGSVSITLDGEALRGLRYTKSIALLGFLAVTGRPHSREALATLLWGGSAAQGGPRLLARRA